MNHNANYQSFVSLDTIKFYARRFVSTLFIQLIAMRVINSPYLTKHYSSKLFLLMLIVIICLVVWRTLVHAGSISRFLGDPFGTLIITLTSVAVEISMVKAIVFQSRADIIHIGYNSFTLIALALNFFGSLCLVINGANARHRRAGVNYYLSFITALVFWLFFFPGDQAISQSQQLIMAIAVICSYLIFFAKQNITHASYFRQLKTSASSSIETTRNRLSNKDIAHFLLEVTMLAWLMFILNAYSENLQVSCAAVTMPYKLTSFLVALIVLLPEGILAVRSTQRGNLMRAINLFQGSVVASLSLTVPALLLYNYFLYHKPLYISFGRLEAYFLLCTALVHGGAFRRKRNTAFHGILGFITLLLYIVFI